MTCDHFWLVRLRHQYVRSYLGVLECEEIRMKGFQIKCMRNKPTAPAEDKAELVSRVSSIPWTYSLFILLCMYNRNLGILLIFQRGSCEEDDSWRLVNISSVVYLKVQDGVQMQCLRQKIPFGRRGLSFLLLSFIVIVKIVLFSRSFSISKMNWLYVGLFNAPDRLRPGCKSIQRSFAP